MAPFQTPRENDQPVDEPARVDFQKLFELTPERYVLLGADAPRFTLLAASDAYLDLVMLGRQEVIGRGLFELFPEDGGEPTPNEQFLMRQAVEKVLREGKPHSLAAYRYDMPDPDAPDQTFERYWSPSLMPLINDDGEVSSILLRIEEATDFVMRERYIHAERSRRKPTEDGRRTVLLVEPDEGWRAHLSSAFSTHWEVEAVATGAEALEVLEHFSPEVVVAATRLPDRCGLGFISDLKATTAIPLLARVDQTDGRRYRAAFEAGADDVIGGPVSAREFMARVQTQFAEAALREATHERIRRQYEQLFMQAPVAISLLEGPDHVYTLNNPALFELIGDRPLLGLPVREAFSEPGMQPLFDRLDEVYETGEPYFATEVPIDLGDEQGRRYATFAYLPYRDPDGVTQGVASFAYDVTEHVEMRVAVERENERKDVFLAMLGHELRNPLAPIAHAAELLQLEADAPEPKRVGWAADIILRQIDQLKHHVDDLLDIARINQGRINIDREEVSLQQVLDKAVEATEARIERQDQHLITTIPQRPITLNVDAARITQVVTNLVDNASKYSSPGSRIWLEARVSQGTNRDQLTLEVRDEGEGIDPELLPDVFDLFTQADVTLDRSRGGLGLGLSLVKRIVELHGGQVSAHSEGIGRGSRFVVDLPVVVAAPRRASSATGAGVLDNARILVVDDRPDLAESLARLLESRGATVHTAQTGAEALEQAVRHEPTHILLDIGLPDIDGYEVGRRLRQRPAGAKTSLIALTGYGRPRDIQKAREAGFDHHLTKPAHLSELLELIAKPAVDGPG